MQNTVTYDRAAVALSLFCIAHCIALPVLAITLPFLAVFAEAEWVHRVLAVLAVLASLSVIASAHTSRTPLFLVPALTGLGLIIGGLFAENFGMDETLPTVAGGMLLAAAHIYRIFKHS
ncbi:MerC domain-containing protein [Pontixanthobacter aestiaquae]|uniref:MerC family mercury resistance protein n=1 Tax=Pontixanthobacter aestiaquae TaxID=1509367 RepID=A0A844ZA16_9SPHN|nr:MerC domain-containing protein [Pontixanthobacter aestiaquae]MDN3644845.1 MerC domain-containing protein [Pontixanthobacter aestiaquae]MXO84152.1 MerC family mercury resistance protein [Pontixanthobacter aestiaquae]